MLQRIVKRIEYQLKDLSRWRTQQKIVVFESDDWGSIRMASRQNYEHLLSKGIRVDKDAYCRFDGLESEDDLELLFATLSAYRDCQNQPAVFTANSLVANPDFDKIAASGYQDYHYETIADTFRRYPKHGRGIDLWQEGRRAGVFHNEFHGREHLNVSRWMRNLQEKSPETLLAFGDRMFGISTTVSNENRKSYMAAFDADSAEEIENQKAIIEDGIALFKSILGYAPGSFIAPNYTWSSTLEPTLVNAGIKGIQGNRIQKMPSFNKGKPGTKVHYLGEKGKLGQVYTIRNVTFEPSFGTLADPVDAAMKQIADAFSQRRPAIISSHRLNYVSLLDEANRDDNLRLLRSLLGRMLKQWPDIVFLTSGGLVKMIEE